MHAEKESEAEEGESETEVKKKERERDGSDGRDREDKSREDGVEVERLYGWRELLKFEKEGEILYVCMLRRALQCFIEMQRIRICSSMRLFRRVKTGMLSKFKKKIRNSGYCK